MISAADLVHPECGTAGPFRYGPWTWREPEHGEHFRRCSFCGSVHPEDLAAEPVWHANWADRKYGWPHKFYVDIPNRNPDALFVVSTINFEPTGDGWPVHGNWVAIGDLTPEQRAVYQRDYAYRAGEEDHTRYVTFAKRPHHWGKFYTIHLADLRIPIEAKAAIHERSGLVFSFTVDGRVSWRKP